MAQTLTHTAACPSASVSRRESYRQQAALPSLARSVARRQSRRCATTPRALAVGGVADDFGLSSGSSASYLLTQAATLSAIGLAAWFSARLLDQVGGRRVCQQLLEAGVVVPSKHGSICGFPLL